MWWRGFTGWVEERGGPRETKLPVAGGAVDEEGRGVVGRDIIGGGGEGEDVVDARDGR